MFHLWVKKRKKQKKKTLFIQISQYILRHIWSFFLKYFRAWLCWRITHHGIHKKFLQWRYFMLLWMLCSECNMWSTTLAAKLKLIWIRLNKMLFYFRFFRYLLKLSFLIRRVIFSFTGDLLIFFFTESFVHQILNFI